ncbi:MAG: hypothetical protein H5T86_03045 [Armatimonadetes bacterium]|nr:hypothetical protein [Armatimonadota bacterium]
MRFVSRRLLPLAAAVPFLLLHQSEDLRLLTHIERDGSGLRMVWARGNISRLPEVHTRIREATPEYEDEKLSAEGSQFIIARTWRPHTLALVPDASLAVTDIPQAPLSLYNTYQWREELKIYSQTATPSEKAGAEAAQLIYVLEMPGAVVPESVSPPGSISGGRVVWTLTGDRETYTLTATSRMLRWDILVILVYLLGVAAVKGIQLSAAWARRRPRRI